MRRDSSRLFEIIQFGESITVLDIQIRVSVIVNEIQTVAGAFFCALDVHKKSRVLLFEFQHTPAHLHIYIYIYIYILCMCDIILTTSYALIFILLVFLMKHMPVDPIQPIRV